MSLPRQAQTIRYTLRDLARGTMYLYVAIDAVNDNQFPGRGDFGGYSGGTLEAPLYTDKEAKGILLSESRTDGDFALGTLDFRR